MMWWALAATGVAVLGVAVAAAVVLRRGAVSPEEAIRLFRQQREHLEAEFFRAAAASGKPRGLRWKECCWGPEVAFARERATGALAALAEMTVAFEAIPGGDMEGLPAVGNLRQACGVFFFARDRWRTRGQAVFNLTPAEAVQRFQGRYDPLGASGGASGGSAGGRG